MAHGQEINLHDVKIAGDNLNAFANQMTARLKAIKAEVQALSGKYEGLGAAAFQKSMAGWDATALNIRRSIFELAGQVRVAGKTHLAGDHETIADFNAHSGG